MGLSRSIEPKCFEINISILFAILMFPGLCKHSCTGDKYCIRHETSRHVDKKFHHKPMEALCSSKKFSHKLICPKRKCAYAML